MKAYKNFKPDYRNIVDCAYNRKPKRIPLYDHSIDDGIAQRVTGRKFPDPAVDLDGYFREYCGAQRDLGYDAVEFEGCITRVLPNGGALAHPRPGWIDSPEKFRDYPFGKIKDLYAAAFRPQFAALQRQMPEGMRAIGGVGNGVFEIAQDLCGFEGLCVLKYDEPGIYEGIFVKIGDMMVEIWEWFLNEFPDLFCVVRFGDDLGYKSNTMLPAEDIVKHIIPQYKRIVDLVHKRNKPFLLHSCGNIFNVMPDIIRIAKIDAKHSNEDQIAPFGAWVEKYGGKIGNFGGVDTDRLVAMDNEKLAALVADVYNMAAAKDGGFAIGSGNSIPYYTDPEKYLIMINTVRRLRGDT